MQKKIRNLFLFLTMMSSGTGLVVAIHRGFRYTIQLKGLYPEVSFPWEQTLTTLMIWGIIAAIMYLIAQVLAEEVTELEERGDMFFGHKLEE